MTTNLSEGCITADRIKIDIKSLISQHGGNDTQTKKL